MIRISFIVLLFAFITAELNFAAQDIIISDSTSITGCWMSQQSKSEESLYDSLYNTNYYYVHLNMCVDEYNNIEISRKIKIDCCNEDNHNFKGTYKLQNDTLIIFLDGSRSSENYLFKTVSNTLYLKPLNIKKDNSDSPLLKYRWLRY